MYVESPMRSVILIVPALVLCGFATADDGPIVPPEFAVDVVAKEPLVRNPCAMAFDRLGRICIGQGPQYRHPTPKTPGDRVDILMDASGDGIADRIHTFAQGFNCIQGLAWHGRDLWVANAPDLTIVRDLDGDDVADEYVVVYTGLGNLEHGLHGLSFGPDGLLYMSKGNSRGYNRLDQLAPKPFRELWGLPSPPGAPDYTPLKTTSAADYRRAYHTPADDWGQQGGILRCRPNGRDLEIVARGFRNPWDIAFDDSFCWLGTDNDQSQGDKIFSPFPRAHFGWGHTWSSHWSGRGHLPSVPASAPLFEGSGTGVVHYHAKQFPAQYRNAFFVNDWLRRELRVFRPKWAGALMTCSGSTPPIFAHAGGGRAMAASSGRVFEPTDIEVGPDGCLYVLSWGHAYGATVKDGKQVDAGRVYRIRHRKTELQRWQTDSRKRPIREWSLKELIAEFDTGIPAWRTNAQEELLRRGEPAEAFLSARHRTGFRSTAEETWALWTLGRMPDTDPLFHELLLDADASLNSRVQALRIVAHRVRRGLTERFPSAAVQAFLQSGEARLRHEAVLAIGQARDSESVPALEQLASRESDRIVFYSAWNAARDLTDRPTRRAWLQSDSSGVRLAGLLSLLEDEALSIEDVLPLRGDTDERVREVAELWLRKTGGLDPIVKFTPEPGTFGQPVSVTLSTNIPGAVLMYTLDGSVPVKTSPRYKGPIMINGDQTLRVAVGQNGVRQGPVMTARYKVRSAEAYRHRAFVTDVTPASGRRYRMDWSGLSVGKQHYTDRAYTITQVPTELQGTPFLQTANNDDRTSGTELLKLRTTEPVSVLVGVDVRVNQPLAWMRINAPDGFRDTGLTVVTTDPTFRLFEKSFPAGEIVLGGNTNNPKTDSRRGNYIVVLKRHLLDAPRATPASAAEVLAALNEADASRGRELFLSPQGVGCVRCHAIDGFGNRFAPDLSDIGSRVRKPEILIESILNPSAVITEGFAQQSIVTTDGRTLSGAIVDETRRTLRIVDSDANATTLRKQDIEHRQSTRLSPMPSGYGRMMSAQQLADLVAWLMTQQVVGERSGFWFKDTDSQLHLHYGDQRIGSWLKRHETLTRPALVNVHTLSGLPVTRRFPPRLPEDRSIGFRGQGGIDHPQMHPGLWMSFGDLNGNDYWRLQSRVEFAGYVEPPRADASSASFAVRNKYLDKSGKSVVCEERLSLRFERVEAGIHLVLRASYYSDEHDFYFGDQEESGLAVRVASPLRVEGGNGTILNDRGQRNGAQVRGTKPGWFDYFGTTQNRTVGIMVVPNPNNPRPSWLHARDYGVVVTNPFPQQPRERREPFVKTWVRKGQPFTLAYGVLIHDLPAEKPFDRQAAARLSLTKLRGSR